MAAKTYTITEAKAQLSALIRRVKRGESITIGAGRTPEVEIVVYNPTQRKRVFGRLKGKIWLSPDFNERDEDIEHMFQEDA